MRAQSSSLRPDGPGLMEFVPIGGVLLLITACVGPYLLYKIFSRRR
jgi:hypothetical protein